MTLISAPAGFGKSTAIIDWLAAEAGDPPSVGWLSLDQRDNDPVVFWSYVVAALRSAADDLGDSALARLQGSPVSPEAVAAALVNDLSRGTDKIVLVLDDYHVIEASEVHESVTFLLEHLPSRLHVMIGTRVDPPLPIARLRAAGELVEIRAPELRFTSAEAAVYFQQELGQVLSSEHVATLEARTEGWIAALQLATLSMRGLEDVSSFIAEFAGEDRYIIDYLADEVLERQSPDVRMFLLQTSILERLTAPLCDAVTTSADGRAKLALLERANLFVVPLDDRRRWYRYHHLFADVLQAHLLDEQPGLIHDLHRRASVWFEHNGDQAEAVRHAVAAADFGRAADLTELALPVLMRQRQEATLRAWLKLLPNDVVRVRPVLNLGFVGVLAAAGQFDGVEARLRDIEAAVDGPATERVVADLRRLRFVPGAVGMYRAAQALVGGDVTGTMTHACRVLQVAPDDDHLNRAGAAGLLGLALWTTGDLDAAYDSYAECAAGLRGVGHVADVLGCSIALADIRIAQGRLSDALRIYNEGLRLASDQPGELPRGAADMHVGIAQVLLERNDLDDAAEHLRQSDRLGAENGMPQNPHRWRLAMARLHEAQGELGEAVALLDEAEELYVSDFFPNVRPIPALRARVQLARGDLDAALGWARAEGLTADDRVDYLTEFDHITFARVLLARHAEDRSERWLDGATGLLERLLVGAEAGCRQGAVIEILVVQALAHQAAGDGSAALACLGQSLARAEPEGYARLFSHEGRAIAPLLRSLAKHESRYARQLLTSATVERQAILEQPLIDPLSDRELDVLRLLASDLSGPDIARELLVSLNTLRTHTKNIYAKLGANNRREAVRRGRQLGL